MQENTPPKSSGLLRANVVVAGGTFLSRITGFLKVLAMAAVFGFSGLSDAYNTANTTPNIIYELMLGGILSAVLVPMFVRQFEDNDSEAMSAVISVAVCALFVLTVVMMACAPLIMQVYGLNRGADHALFLSVGTSLAYFFLPQIFFYGLMSLVTALLNARKAFAGPAYAPILNNLIVIGMLAIVAVFYKGDLGLAYAAEHGGLVTLLGIGTTAGIAISVLILVPTMKARALPLSFKPNWRHPAVKKLLGLSGWTIGYVVANQIALFVVTTLALGHEGWQSAYQTAFTFFLLPHGLFAVSIMSTFTPDLSRSAARGLWEEHKEKLLQGLRALVLLMLPASIGYMLVAEPLVTMLLHHGRFSAEDAALTSETLAMFALGLLPFSVYLYLLRSFYAKEDTKTVFLLNLFENALNILFAIPLVRVMGVAGLSLSYTLAYFCAAILTGYVLGRRLEGGIPWRAFFSRLLPVFLAVLVMAVVAGGVIALPLPAWMSLLGAVIAGGGCYVLTGYILSVPEARMLLKFRPK